MKNLLKNKQKEGEVAKTIESVTSSLPSDLFLWTAVGAMAASLVFQAVDKKHIGLFFGQWVAPLLLFGVYNKLVKIGGHDKDRPEVETPARLEQMQSSYM
jgi:hypothetical protein